MKIIHGQQIIYGVRDPLPLNGFPRGQKRLRMRSDRFASVFVRNEYGICEYSIKEESGVWVPAFQIGRNHRPV